MTDRTSSIFKPIHAQFRAAQIVVCCAASVFADRPITTVQPPQPTPPSITAPVPTTITRSYVITRPVLTDTDSEKSSAQVAPSVLHPGVIQKACELKLGKKVRPPVPVRYSESQLEVLEAKARKAGLSRSEYIRALSLGGEYQPPDDKGLTRALLGLVRELTAQGRNLNQIAHGRNAGTLTEAQTDSMLDILGRSILRTLQAVRQRLTQNTGPMP